MYQRSIVERLESRSLLSGGLDPTFGTNGVVSGEVDYLPGGVPVAVMVRPDKRIVVAANYTLGNDPSSQTGEALLGLQPDGSLDPTFGVKGVEDLGVTPFHSVSKAVLQTDGKILVIGDDAGSDLILARFNADGSPDTTFADDGFATVDIPAGFTPNNSGVSTQVMAIQSDGAIVAADMLVNSESLAPFTIIRVMRFTSAGVLDGTFATGGVLSIPDSPIALTRLAGIAVNPTGEIAIAGDQGIACVSASGALNTAFGTDGIVTLPNSVIPSDIAFLASGKIVVGGTSTDVASGSAMLAERFTASGRVDPSFGNKGQTVITLHDRSVTKQTDPNGFVDAMAIDRAGRIVLGGGVSLFGEGSSEVSFPSDFAAVRLTASGRLDPSFGVGGKQSITGGNLWPTISNSVDAVAIEADGTIVLAGASANEPNSVTGALVLARDTASGRLDTHFGYLGRAGIFPNVPPSQLAALQSDGKLVLAGAYSIARLSPDGSLDPTFGVQGLDLDSHDQVDDDRNATIRQLLAIRVLPNGQIVEALQLFDQTTQVTRFELLRYAANGRIDASSRNDIAAEAQLSRRFKGFAVEQAFIQSDGRTILEAQSDNQANIIVRLTAGGAIDSSFGKNGAVLLNPFGDGNDFYPEFFNDSTGGLIMVGTGTPTSDSPDGTVPQQRVQSIFSLIAIRLDDHGHLDANFGAAPIPIGTSMDTHILSDAQQDDGSIDVLLNQSGTESIIHLVDGDADPSFGADSVLSLQLPSGFSPSGGLALLNNRFYVDIADGNGIPQLAAFDTSGNLDDTFADNGVLALPPTSNPYTLSANSSNGTITLVNPSATVVRITT